MLAITGLQSVWAQSVNRYGAIEIPQRIFFDSSDAVLDSHDLKVLNKVALLMKRKPNGLFEVEGHTDTTGRRAYNAKLGVFRAQVVKKQLVELGIPEAQLIAFGRGETEPFRIKGRYNANKSRRVEFRQVAKLDIKISDKNSGKLLNADLDLTFANRPYGVWKLTASKGKHQWILPYRKAYYLQTGMPGYISQIDTIKPHQKSPDGSSMALQIRLRPAVIKERVNFESIYFLTGKAAITPGSEEALQNIYDLLVSNPEAYIEIRGHVSQPDRSKLPDDIIKQGKDLSERRARSIYNEMVKRGISPTRMTYRGMGSSEMKYPSPQNEDEEKMNRRVEILILELK